MDCPCYRAIYSAAAKLPSSMVALVSDYAHTFSDSDFERLIYADIKMFMLNMHDDAVAYSFNGNRHGAFMIAGPSINWGFIKNWVDINQPYAPIKWFVIIIGYNDACDNKFSSRGDLYIDKLAWEFVQHHFGRDDGDYVARRSAIWRNIKPAKGLSLDIPMPEIFDRWCDQVLETIGNELYRRPHTLVCPWSEEDEVT